MKMTSSLSFFETYLSLQGRISRRLFLSAFLLLFISYLNGYLLLSLCVENITTQAMYLFIPFAWGYLAIYSKRCHDINRSAYHLLWLLLPVIGPIYVNFLVFFKKTRDKHNRYGTAKYQQAAEYFKNPSLSQQANPVVNDVTQCNPITVSEVYMPTEVAQLVQFIKTHNKPLSIGGGRFSMGGQTASPNSVHLDMRQLNQVLDVSLEEKTIRVQAGIRWCDIQQVIDPLGLSVAIMQTYANFTVGGSLSVNAHGRYMGLGPLVLSVNEITLVLANGDIKHASPQQDSELFYAAIGGYGGIGVIVEAELALAQNCLVQRRHKKMPCQAYLPYFKQRVQSNNSIIFHNADIYPKKYHKLHAVSWQQINQPLPSDSTQQPIKRSYPLARYFIWAISRTPFGKWRREYIIDKLLFRRTQTHSRNYEAGYNVAELAPIATDKFTWVLQEYFIPIAQLDTFLPLIREILQRYQVNALNISIRYAKQDPGTLLAWAKTDVFAFVLYYRQGLTAADKNKVAIWTRELIDAVLHCQGRYYLPYQIHATPAQFHQAYPNAKQFFALKNKLDPDYRLRNKLWDSYYQPSTQETLSMSSIYHTMLAETHYHDKLFLFLQNIFHVFPEDKFFALIKTTCEENNTEEAVYTRTQEKLTTIKPFLADLTYALPALFKQKQVIVAQTLQLLGEQTSIDGYVEIGTTGRYLSRLRKRLDLQGKAYLINDQAPSNSIIDIVERGAIKKIGEYLPLNDYAPIASDTIADASVDLVTCYIGLHHVALDKLPAFIDSIVRILRPGGRFILREHDCTNNDMKTFCSLIHSVFNLGTDVSWADNAKERRQFRSVEQWQTLLGNYGLQADEQALLQDNDPSMNALMLFSKPA